MVSIGILIQTKGKMKSYQTLPVQSDKKQSPVHQRILFFTLFPFSRIFESVGNHR